MARERISCPFELKSVDDSGTFTGYASVFGVVDWWDDVVEAGAFADSLKAGPRPCSGSTTWTSPSGPGRN